MIVQLSTAEVQMCALVAVQRWAMKFDSEDRPNYAQGKAAGKLEHDLLADVRSLVAEWACAKHYNVTWNFPLWPNELHPARKKLPDIGFSGEVRTIRTSSGIPFWEKDRDKMICGARIVDERTFREVEIFKRFSAELYFLDEYADPSINGWRMPIEHLTLSPTETTHHV